MRSTSCRGPEPRTCHEQALPEPQWLNCDVRTFDMSVLGKFGVIMTDPPWEIHQARAAWGLDTKSAVG